MDDLLLYILEFFQLTAPVIIHSLSLGRRIAYVTHRLISFKVDLHKDQKMHIAKCDLHLIVEISIPLISLADNLSPMIRRQNTH